MAKEKKEKKEKKLSLDDALKAIRKKHGDGSVVQGNTGIVKCDVIPTSSLKLDLALGVGGIPRGRITEISGPEGGGKTTLALHCVANVQKVGGKAVYIDVEHALDPIYAEHIGVKMNDMILSQPDHGEQVFDILETVVGTGEVQLVVIDSVAAIVPKAQLEGELEDKYMGGIGALMSRALSRMVRPVKNSNTAIIFINQLRDKIGGMAYGSHDKTTGGRSLPYYASVRLDIRRIGSIKKNDIPIGNEVVVKVTKNKVAPPFRKAEFEIIFGKGISSGGCLLDLAVDHGLIDKNGSNFYMNINNEKQCIGNGRFQAVKFIESDKNVADNIDKHIRDKFMAQITDNVVLDDQIYTGNDDDTEVEESVE